MKTWHQLVTWYSEPIFVIIFTVWLDYLLNLQKKMFNSLTYFILLPLSGTGKIRPLSY